MSKTYLEIQNTLSSKVFGNTNLRQSIEIQTYTTSENAFNETIETFSVQTVVYGIVLDYKQFGRSYDQSGLYNNSDFILLIPQNTTVTEHDRVVFNSSTYIILGINPQPYGGGFTHKELYVKLTN